MQAIRGDRRHHVTAVACEVTAINLSMITGDQALATRLDEGEAKLETRIDAIEAAAIEASVERRTMGKVGAGLLALLSAIWGIVTFAVPLLVK